MSLTTQIPRSMVLPAGAPETELNPVEAGERLAAFIRRHPRLMILTGAGVSTDSGIPDYRDGEGAWKRKPPVQHGDFMENPATRQRYWGRSLIGWPVIRNARPNRAHNRIAQLESLGHSNLLVTQNVDRLHQQAGSENVLDLHGRADQVLCMACGFRSSRDEVHERCAALNARFTGFTAETAPDGDADLEVDFSGFEVANCPCCDGILKPDVVFFGDFVPKTRVTTALEALESSDGLLVIGSSLMVYSGFRFCRYGHDWGKPMATLTLGRTRADPLVETRLNAPISETLEVALERL